MIECASSSYGIHWRALVSIDNRSIGLGIALGLLHHRHPDGLLPIDCGPSSMLSFIQYLFILYAYALSKALWAVNLEWA